MPATCAQHMRACKGVRSAEFWSMPSYGPGPRDAPRKERQAGDGTVADASANADAWMQQPNIHGVAAPGSLHPSC